MLDKSKDGRIAAPAIVAAVLLAVVALVAGCGGGDDSSGGESTSAAREAGEAGGAGSPGAAGGSSEGPNGSNQAGPEEGAQPKGAAGSGKPQSPKARFVKEASAICSRSLEEALNAVRLQAQQAEPKSGAEEGEIQAEAIDPYFLPPIQEQIDEIRDLEPPPGDEPQIEAFLDARQDEVDLIEEKDYNSSTVLRFGTEFKPSSDLARKYGLAGCQIA